MKWTEVLAIWMIVAVAASPFIGSLLAKRRTRREFQADVAGAAECARAECARLKKLLELADEFDSAPSDKHRQAIYRKAESLGLCDPPYRDNQPRRSA